MDVLNCVRAEQTWCFENLRVFLPNNIERERAQALRTGNHDVWNSVPVFSVPRNPNRSRLVLVRGRLCGRGLDQRSDLANECFRIVLSLSVEVIGKHPSRYSAPCISSAAGNN